jgi:hypothetical protein
MKVKQLISTPLEPCSDSHPDYSDLQEMQAQNLSKF